MKEKIEKWFDSLVDSIKVRNSVSTMLADEGIVVVRDSKHIQFDSGLRMFADMFGLEIAEKIVKSSFNHGFYRQVTTFYKGIELVQLERIEE